MTFVNYTPHPINIFREEDVEFSASLRKNIVRNGAEPFFTIPPSGELLNAQMGYIPDGPDGVLDGVPVFKAAPISADVPPDGNIIVSRMYAATVVATYMFINGPVMFVVHQPVYKLNDDGSTTPIGYLGLEKV